MTLRWAIVDDIDTRQCAAGQMAADLAVADQVAQGGIPVLRLYTWSPPALSLGRFQPATDVDGVACEMHGVEVVRRPTGGRALLHGADVTYAVAMPRPAGRHGSVDAVYRHLAGGLRAGLAELGVTAEVASNTGLTGAACFASQAGSDLRAGGRKVCGSAQVVRDGVVLQHGSILLDRLAFDETDLLHYDDPATRRGERNRLAASTVTLRELGVRAAPREVADALQRGFASALGVSLLASTSS